ncbi:MAG: hypothetical protein Q7S14_03870 [bacterium]|nr:hypothetical protein [bacterium]
MIKKCAKEIQLRYIEARQKDGSATETSLSEPMFRPLIENGIYGLSQGIHNTRQILKIEESWLPRSVAEAVYWNRWL